MRRAWGPVVCVLALGALVPATTAPAANRLPVASVAGPLSAAVVRPPVQTRYSLVHGCYSIVKASGGQLAPSDGPFRMQAAALGKYLLYGRHHDFVGPDLVPVAAPSEATVWRVDGSSRTGFTITNVATGRAVGVSFATAQGCVGYPEAEVDAVGTPFTGSTPASSVLGTVEGHAHITAFELFGGDWHCGRPWSPYGAPFALPASCAADQQGTNGSFEALLDFGSPTAPTDMHGWPTFVRWPSPTAVAEEGDYYTAIERAWMAGLRVVVSNNVDNEALCRLMTKVEHACNDMVSTRIQAHDLYALQDYIDAQSGGPGKGFFRIVTDPFQARRVINSGKLAVIEGIEVSRIFGCGESGGVPQCDRAQIDAGLKEVHDLGVRTFFPVHEFNNAFGGSKMIGGETGVIINLGNRQETGGFFTLQPCSPAQQDAEQFTVPATGVFAQLLNGPLFSMVGGNPLPVYAPGPQCNVQGLTHLGGYLIRQMIKQHVIIQLDHMDSKTAAAALAIAQSQHYSGVVSAHCCNSPQLFNGIYGTGGFITEPQTSPTSFVTTYLSDKAQNRSKYAFGFGYGSDMNGLAQQAGPDTSNPIGYPFKSFDGRVTFTRERWGQRVFDLNKDGLANYGMYADWLQAVTQAGGHAAAGDMFRGAESYLEMWERAAGVPGQTCAPSRGVLRSGGVGALRLGASFQSLLFGAGQPAARPGRSYVYCVTRSRGTRLTAVFGSAGRAELLASTARGYRAGGLHPGSLAKRVAHVARSLGRGLWLGAKLSHGSRFVYGVSRHRVKWVAVVTASVARHPSTLRGDLHAAGVA